jgi:hypothetical protein
VIQKAATLTLDNVNAEGFKYTINVAASSVGSNITINGGSYSGYAAMNITGGNTEVTANDVAFFGLNDVDAHESNAFAAIAIGDGADGKVVDGVKVTVNGGTIGGSSTNGNRQAAVQVIAAANAEVYLDAELTLVNGEVFSGDISMVELAVRAEYADELNAQGYAVQDAAAGMVVAGAAVAETAGVNYSTLAAAMAARAFSTLWAPGT